MKEALKIQAVQFVQVETIIPEEWSEWFWMSLSESSTITFGDNDFSLISAERFLDEVKLVLEFEREVDQKEVQQIREKLLACAQQKVYINLWSGK